MSARSGTAHGVIRYSFSAGKAAGTGRGADDRHAENSRTSDDFAVRVDLWDESRSSLEAVLAMTSSIAIGYAAYYAALTLFPGRYITLSTKDRTIARSQ